MSTLRANAIIDAAGGNTATINGIPLRQGILDPENRIINGAFDFWQRGTSFTTAVYGADRWVNGTSGSGTVTQARQAFTVGDILGSNSPTYFLRQTVSGQSGAGAYAITNQNIEGVRSYAGQTITVLGWARRSSGSGNMVVEGVQNFGTGGSPSGVVTAISPTTVTLTGSFAPFAVVLTVPSITGKTLGTNGNDYFQIEFWTSGGSDWNARNNSLGIQTIGVDLWGIHIKLGTHTTDAVSLYKQPELEAELARCQRYCHVVDTGTLSTAPFGRMATTGLTIGSTTTYFPIQFPVIMRGTPSFSASNITNALVYNGSLNQTVSAAFIDQSGRFLFNIGITHAAGLTAGQAAQLTRSNGATPAPALVFDAEL
jgi:hypothetical protein